MIIRFIHLKEALDEAKLEKKDKYNAIKRLESFINVEDAN